MLREIVMHTTDLGGNSGCRILLCETEDNDVFVRKIAGTKEYNKRLKLQADKQINYKRGNIKVPRVFSCGMTDEGLFYFDMEYVSGITLAEYMKSIEVGKVRNLVQLIIEEMVLANNESKEADESIFENKIFSLKEELIKKDNHIINQALNLLENHSWKNFFITACHGDLTLENIIVKDGELYLIDFLDSFYDCWIFDVCTLMQDVQTLWAYRFDDKININTLIRLVVFRDILMDTVREISPGSCLDVYYALLLKLIRIIPYANDVKTYEFLNEKMQSVMAIIRHEEAI